MPDGIPNARESYERYPLVILSQDGHRKIAQTTADSDGAYRVALSPGAYILDLKDRVQAELKAKPQSFTVESNQTVRVDMLISE